MTGDWLDVILVAVGIAFAVSGYRQGFLIGVLSLVGFLGGAVIGMRVASGIGDHIAKTASGQAIVALATVLVISTVGQVVATTVGAALRRRLLWRPLRIVDSVAGGVVSIVAVALVAWIVGDAAVQSPFRTVSREVRHSWVLHRIDDLMPVTVDNLFAPFRRLVAQNGFPRVFSGLGPEPITKVPKPDPRVANSAGVRRARPDIVKVLGYAPACSRQIEGSGFLYAPGRIMTNAHVVAGVRNPTVVLPDHGRISARVVVYDPKRDVAVLAVTGLGARPLSFAGHAADKASAVIAGYPEDAPNLIAVAARVRGTINAQSPDIYQHGSYRREIYAVRGVVRPGNSGGPLLAPDGRVYGVVFAAATDSRDTGYALTAAEVAADARAGASSSSAVSTGGCD